MFTQVKTKQEVTYMRESGKMLATVLDVIKTNIKAGMSTKDISEIAKQELRALGGQPTFLGYMGYPDVICTSINDEVVHGIPSPSKILQNGDLIGIDFGVTYNGMITDSAVTAIVGSPLSNDDKKLVDTTKEALSAGMKQVKNGVRVGDISFAIEKVLKKGGYGIVRELVGHGVGHHLHENPNIPNYGVAHIGPVLITGMTIAIEPMATLGDYRVKTENDNWTIRTTDGSRSAHFEHTVLVTEDGFEILTKL